MYRIRKELGAIIESASVRLRRGLLLAGCLTAVVAVACTTNLDPVTAGSLAFAIPSDSQLIGRTYQLSVIVRDVNGVEISGRTIRYESLNPDIAEADTKGLVTTKHVGTATFRATVDGRSTSAQLRVLDLARNVVVTPLTDNLPIGQSRQMVVTVTSASGQSIGGRVIAWRSTNPTVASVNAQGIVSAVTEGTTIIEASVDLDQVVGRATINVIKVPVVSISMSPVGTTIVRLGNFLQVTATPRDANNNALTGRTITWSSSNPGIATVTQSGLVTAIALGSVTITAECEGRTGSIGVQVFDIPIKSVTLAPDTLPLPSGSTRQLVPIVIDSLNRPVNSLAGRAVLWTSQNPAAATVSSSGVLTALAGGTARVNVTIDNVRSNDIVVIVTDQVQTIRLAPILPQIMRVGNTLQVTATPLNNQGLPITGKTITWATSNPAIATVSQTGVVTAIQPGTIVIIAESEGKTASLGVTVTPVPVSTIVFSPDAETLPRGTQKQYNPVVTDSAGKIVTSFFGRTVSWLSDNVPVASVSPQGLGGVVGASQNNSGLANITVTIDGVVSNVLKITVP
ncbi:MAG: Ig-like domain-containing protein [Gemmatimonadaceae bacterium]